MPWYQRFQFEPHASLFLISGVSPDPLHLCPRGRVSFYRYTAPVKTDLVNDKFFAPAEQQGEDPEQRKDRPAISQQRKIIVASS